MLLFYGIIAYIYVINQDKVTIFPNAKINIGLSVTSKREDGYHNINTIFYPVVLRDALEFVVQIPGEDSDELTQTGLETGCSMNDNIVIKTVNLVRKKFNIPAIKIHLHKVIPPGGGLGGGSSDAAFMIRYLNRYFSLGLSVKEMTGMALSLGSDCPFFIENHPVIATGKGEIMTRVDPLLKGYHILIVNPGIDIDTTEAYAALTPSEPAVSLNDVFKKPVTGWKGIINNDFEEVIFVKYPEIKNIKELMYNNNALYASMTGSGSSVYGIFEGLPPVDDLPSEQWRWRGIL